MRFHLRGKFRFCCGDLIRFCRQPVLLFLLFMLLPFLLVKHVWTMRFPIDKEWHIGMNNFRVLFAVTRPVCVLGR